MKEFHHHPQGRTIHNYAGTFLAWRGNRFVEVEDEALRHKLQAWLHKALRHFVNAKSGVHELIDFESNPNTVKAALESVRAYSHLPISVTPPAWLLNQTSYPDPLELLPCLSGNLHVPSGKMLPPTPALFNINALDFDYDVDAERQSDGLSSWSSYGATTWNRSRHSRNGWAIA